MGAMRGLAAVPARVSRFMREVRAELKKVVWPDRRETAVYTVVVLASVAVVALTIWVVDNVVSGLLTWALFR
ncbi:MAG: preprotein translocase subunit SecE [bacterium]|nr:preprotein translocase subunit SecE [bacterium]